MASLLKRSSGTAESLTTRSGAVAHKYHDNNYTQQLGLPVRKRSRDAQSFDVREASTRKRQRTATPDLKPNAHSLDRSDVNTVNGGLQVEELRPRTIVLNNNGSTSRTHVKLQSQTRRKDVEKVAVDVKGKLDLQQSIASSAKEEKRQLRSHEGSRFKSELSLYFPEYDVVVGNEVEEPHFLNADTSIIITDSRSSMARPQHRHQAMKSLIKMTPDSCEALPDGLFHNLHQAQKIDFSILENNLPHDLHGDPLSDAHYEAAHRRAERMERSIRNTEKGRAQHEKDQVIRLLEGLQGHDWLKIMGVSGITDGRRKEFEAARDHFIDGCRSILEKFRHWKEEEKRRKLVKERVLAEVQSSDDEDGKGTPRHPGDLPDYGDLDHAAAQQLHEEATARSKSNPGRGRKRNGVQETPPLPDVYKEFRSFYSKPYLREAALGKHRRSGRTISAWGQAIPDFPAADFDLPEEYKDSDVIRANERKRRRDRRECKE